jgi:hypothetical protein
MVLKADRQLQLMLEILASIPSSLFDHVEWDSEYHILSLSVKFNNLELNDRLPGPPEAAIASSPIKKSRSSVPRFPLK